jgi:aspartate carbamoyltransferase catalytic subunit
MTLYLPYAILNLEGFKHKGVSMSNLLSVFDLPPIEGFIKKAECFPNLVRVKTLKSKTLGCIFSEPSIRTRWSFESAMHKMGGNVVTSFGPQSTSAEKGESLSDMLRTASQYVDAIVIRTPEPLMNEAGDVLVDLEGVDAHVINAGDGKNEHPTQAMLDAYTIWRKFKRLDSLKFVVVGDLEKSRTIHSLLWLLGSKQLNNCFSVWDFCDKGLGQWEPEAKVKYRTKDNQPSRGGGPVGHRWPRDPATFDYGLIEEDIKNCDVLYLNRYQKERHIGNLASNPFVLTPFVLDLLNKDAIILNPGPRQDEMPSNVDQDPRCKYWEQMKNGLYMRMAVLDWIFSGGL